MTAVSSDQPFSRPEPGATVPVSRTAADLRSRLAALRLKQPDAAVSLVPTMGFFHKGHQSLMRAARRDSDFVVTSIFVNPIQFAPTEDLGAYPRDFERDVALAAAEGVDLIFAPSDSEMYPEGFDTSIEVGAVAEGLCAETRPGHFQGVAMVITKLFNLVRPDAAYFGQKDAQQVAVIKRLNTDLDLGVEIRVCPTVREPDGLAMSSRNTYLNLEERAQAAILYHALCEARLAAAAGETSSSRLRRAMKRTIASEFLVEMEYVKIVDPETMQPVGVIERDALAAVAVKIGRARLIDNEILKTPGGVDDQNSA
jgi:pantoate--beta-alanine ligase